MYNFGAPKIFGAYEHIQYANPTNPLVAGTEDLSGYVLAYVNNTAYAKDKDLAV